MSKQNSFLLFLTFLGANLILIWSFWIRGNINSFASFDISLILVSLGRLFGLVATFLVLMQLLLIGRIPWLENYIGHDRLSIIHHLNGFLALVLIILHPIFIVLGYLEFTDMTFIQNFMNVVLTYPDVLKAFIAYWIFIISVLLSIGIVKLKLRYEVWYFIHIFSYLAIILAFGHQLKVGSDFLSSNSFVYYWYFLYIFVGANLILFRFVKPVINFFRYKFYVDSIVTESDNTVSIYIKGDNLKNFKFDAGQFAIWRFLDLKRFLEAHPFSLSSAYNGEYIRLTPKNLGDFTKNLGGIKKGTRVIMDGPLGVFTLRRTNNNQILLIAGGIGITPLRAILETALKQKRDVALLYIASNASEFPLKNELKKFTNKIYFLDSSREGRLSDSKLISLVPDLIERDVFLCGPSAMMKATIEILKKLGVEESKIYYEKFSLG